MKRIIAAVLTAMLLLSGFGCAAITTVRYANADSYASGDFTYEEGAVKKVEIDWIAGNITLEPGAGTLSVSEQSSGSLSDARRLHWWLDGTTLHIRYCKSGERIRTTEKKDLTVELPAGADLEIDIASGKVAGEAPLDLGAVRIDTASGGVKIETLNAKSVRVDSASGGTTIGKVDVAGAFTVDTASGGLAIDDVCADSVKIDSASGGITLGLKEVGSVDVDVVSGGVKLRLIDKDAGAAIRHSAVSGTFTCSLPYEKSGGTYTIGRGEIPIEIEAVSGNVTVE